MFCDIDDFCKPFEPIFTRHLLQSGHRHRTRRTALALSEILTILVYFHRSHYRTFKHYSTEYVEPHLRPYFPTLVSYTCFVELLPRALVPLCCYLHTRKGRCTGIACIDSTPLAVCHNRRIKAHRVFAGWATRGKTSMGWFYGFNPTATFVFDMRAATQYASPTYPYIPKETAYVTSLSDRRRRLFHPHI
jgi:Transposase DDE domain